MIAHLSGFQPPPQNFSDLQPASCLHQSHATSTQFSYLFTVSCPSRLLSASTDPPPSASYRSRHSLDSQFSSTSRVFPHSFWQSLTGTSRSSCCIADLFDWLSSSAPLSNGYTLSDNSVLFRWATSSSLPGPLTARLCLQAPLSWVAYRCPSSRTLLAGSWPCYSGLWYLAASPALHAPCAGHPVASFLLLSSLLPCVSLLPGSVSHSSILHAALVAAPLAPWHPTAVCGTETHKQPCLIHVLNPVFLFAHWVDQSAFERTVDPRQCVFWGRYVHVQCYESAHWAGHTFNWQIFDHCLGDCEVLVWCLVAGECVTPFPQAVVLACLQGEMLASRAGYLVGHFCETREALRLRKLYELVTCFHPWSRSSCLERAHWMHAPLDSGEYGWWFPTYQGVADCSHIYSASLLSACLRPGLYPRRCPLACSC